MDTTITLPWTEGQPPAYTPTVQFGGVPIGRMQFQGHEIAEARLGNVKVFARQP